MNNPQLLWAKSSSLKPSPHPQLWRPGLEQPFGSQSPPQAGSLPSTTIQSQSCP